MMSPFNSKLRIWTAQTPDYTYLWLSLETICGERWEIYIYKGIILGSFQKVEAFG